MPGKIKESLKGKKKLIILVVIIIFAAVSIADFLIQDPLNENKKAVSMWTTVVQSANNYSSEGGKESLFNALNELYDFKMTCDDKSLFNENFLEYYTAHKSKTDLIKETVEIEEYLRIARHTDDQMVIYFKAAFEQFMLDNCELFAKSQPVSISAFINSSKKGSKGYYKNPKGKVTPHNSKTKRTEIHENKELEKETHTYYETVKVTYYGDWAVAKETGERWVPLRETETTVEDPESKYGSHVEFGFTGGYDESYEEEHYFYKGKGVRAIDGYVGENFEVYKIDDVLIVEKRYNSSVSKEIMTENRFNDTYMKLTDYCYIEK